MAPTGPDGGLEGRVGYSWIPVLGQFTVDGDRIVFKGGETPTAPSSPGVGTPLEEPPSGARTIKNAGIVLCDRLMVHGTLEASITFTGDITPSTVCELVFAYYIPTQSHLGAGLGGGGGAFSIRGWLSGNTGQQSGGRTDPPRWLDLQVLGDRQNLKPGVAYDLKVSVRGVEVTLEVAGVRLLRPRCRLPPANLGKLVSSVWANTTSSSRTSRPMSAVRGRLS